MDSWCFLSFSRRIDPVTAKVLKRGRRLLEESFLTLAPDSDLFNDPQVSNKSRLLVYTTLVCQVRSYSACGYRLRDFLNELGARASCRFKFQKRNQLSYARTRFPSATA